ESEIKVGAMTKRSQQKRSYGPVNFKERVFVLTQSKLSYYEGTIYKRGKVKGSFPVSTITFVGPINDRALNRKNHTYTTIKIYVLLITPQEIIHNDCYLYCCTRSQDERNEWINAIKQVCQSQNNFLKDHYHPDIYNNGMWQCCNHSEKNARGCQTSGDAQPHAPGPLPKVNGPEYPPISIKPNHAPQVHDQETTVVALYDFTPQESGDVALTMGETYTVTDTSRPYWWKVRNKRGEEGYIPANFVKYQTGDGLETMSWFQKDMTRQRAEYLLKQDGKEGNFIVRDSSQPSVIYTLSVVTKGGQIKGPVVVKHYHIKKNSCDEFYLSEKHSMPNIIDLINYHKHNAGGLVTRLRQAPLSLEGNPQPSTHMFSNSKWEIDFNELDFHSELGSGQFGVVKLATIRGKQYVAVKIMKEGTMEEDQFIEEAEVMTKLTHPNLVGLYGVVVQQRPICIVTEFMEEGCLLDYIRKHTHLQSHPDHLLDMSYQICSAMKYLESQNMIHRDLAARNCLVGRNMVVKVADFGLTRYVLDDEYTSSLGSKFPIKWAAPEVLNYTKFSSKSDVWAFGILVWELFTGGKMPYRALSNTEVVERVAHGHRLERPQSCPHDVYRLMLKTWDMEPEKRPSFNNLCYEVEDIIDVVN
uniref:Tyrosine-protein kinase n=1 Tax=Ciona savignyi TaxID=51511 RepID=H2ZIU4_CIOSA